MVPRVPLVASKRTAVVVITALFAGVTALRWATDSVNDGSALLYVLPIALAGVVFGARAGLVSAGVGIALLAAWALANDAQLSLLGWISRSTVMLLLGGLLGATADGLRAGESRFRVSIENLLDPFVILKAERDTEGRIVDFVYEFANDAACDETRVAPGTLVGRRLLELLPGHRDAGLFDEYRRVVESGEPLAVDNFAFEDGRDGDPRERVFDVRAVKAGDGIAYTWRDVTARVEAEAALSEQARRLLEAQSLASLTWWEWSADTPDVIAASPELASTLGVALPGRLTRRDLDDLLDPEERRVLYEAAARAVRDGGRFQHDVPLPASRRWIQVRGEAVGAGSLRGTVQDVTELRRAEETRRDLVLAIARHRDAIEINDSIVQALAVAKWMLEAGKADRGLEAVADALETAQHLVNGLLDDRLHADALRSRPSNGARER